MSIVQENFRVAKRMIDDLPESGSYKRVKKELNHIADLLPKTAYTSRTKSYGVIADIRNQSIKNSMFDISERLDISSGSDGEKYLKVEDIRYNYRNNHRSIRRAWENSGKKGVKEYVQFINDNNEKLNNFHKTYSETKVARILTQATTI